MRIAAILSAAAALFAAAPALTQSWFEYTSREDLFTINFPADPQIEPIEFPSEYGAVFPGRVYSVRLGESLYSVTVVDYTDAQRIHQARTNQTEADAPAGYEYWRIDKLASVAYVATQFRQRGGTVTYDAWHHIDRVPGQMLQITNPDQSRTYATMYLHASRLYVVEATVPRTAPPQGHFQQSLGFIDENGDDIRYDWAPDDSLVRSD
jgi:hypothetical protein